MTHSFLLEQKSIPVPRELAAAIGLEEAIVLQQLYYCLMNDKMLGTDRGGDKWIRNPVECQDTEKQQRAEEHGKDIDWLSNFPFLKPHKIRQVFSNLETLGLVVSSKLRAAKRDMCKYYKIEWNNLTELLKSLSLPICQIPTNGFSKNEQIHLQTVRKSYQYTSSTLVFQELERDANLNFLEKEKKEPIAEQEIHTEKKPKLIELEEDYRPDEFPPTVAPGCSPIDVMPHQSQEEPENDEIYRFQQELEELGGQLKKKNPVAWAHKIVENLLTNGRPCTYWKEFQAGVPLGSTDQREWEIKPGVPCTIAFECVKEDFLAKPGTSPTEAARKAGQVFNCPSQAEAVWEAIKKRVVFLRDRWKDQEKLGVTTPVVDPWMVEQPTTSKTEAAIAMHELQVASLSALGPAPQEIQPALSPVVEEIPTLPEALEDEDPDAAAKGKASILAALSRHKPPARRRQRNEIAVDKLPAVENISAATKPPEIDEPILW